MRVHQAGIPALVLAAGTYAASESADERASFSIADRASAHLARAHGFALKHSAAFARDLRTTFRSVLPARAPPSNSLGARDSSQAVLDEGHKLFCTVPKLGASPVPNKNGTDPGHGSNTSSKSGSPTSTKAGGTSQTGTATAPSATSSWKVFHSYAGNDFFNDWDFFVGSDPTNGAVTFINANDAQAANLSYVNSAGNLIMAVETTPQVQNTRKSIRITNKDSYNGALLVMSATHMPTGCGTWPAFWSNGPNWPAGGEIDIVEGVSNYIANQATIHTNPGCSLSASSASSLGMTGTLVGGQDCAAASTGNQGCGVRATDQQSFGSAFNANGGGIYAMRWDTSGIAIYFFRPDAVPTDLTSNAPTPENWGLPMAHWPSTNCDPMKFFSNHNTIFDTTLCGDWAEGVWNTAGVPGQSESCAQITGAKTCVDFIKANGEAFAEAYWEVEYVKIFQTS